MLKKVKLYFLMFIMLSLVSCATLNIGGPSKQDLVTTYSTVGNTLFAAYSTVKTDCDTKLLKPEACVVYKDYYKEARILYIDAGDALEAYINSDTPEGKTKAITVYNEKIAKIGVLVNKMREKK